MAIQSPDRVAAAPVTDDFTARAPEALRPLYAVDTALEPLYETIADCPSCILAKTRSRTVPGSGPITADLMFVGEAPGQREDELGLPFVGRSGQFLDELLAGIGLTRRDVYVTNVVKCRPPSNRDPSEAEIAACDDYLERQIALINPKVIATLGRFSMARWFPDAKISRIHGQTKRTDDRYVIPMYHPAAALRNGSLREVMHADFAKIPPLLQGEPLTPTTPPGTPTTNRPSTTPPQGAQSGPSL